MDTLLHILVSGLLIGIFVSAPMGPIGMLVIQRTLNKGRLPALFTGVGAALSDLTYSLLTGLGLSFITDFITANEMLLQIVGSVVLIAFAFYLFKKNPTIALRRPEDVPNSYWMDFATGFLFTFANPLILFFIIGLFARFNFILPEFRYYHYILGYASIFAGALTWWWVITFFVNKVRSHFNMRSLWIFNRIIAGILALMAIYGLYSGVAEYLNLPAI
ncbi:MAG: LysE family translocator [Muribaculaceae bacterium]|nr:LysE family translocator [Muribaculaceae bacterium]